MKKFVIFSHETDGRGGLRRSELECEEQQVKRSVRSWEVLGNQIDGVVEDQGGHLEQRSDLYKRKGKR